MTEMRTQTGKNQRGIVSIMVTMIMMIVITLIVVGFAQVARRNQREALDNQLSTEAYYAAESGVNDVVRTIEANTVVDLYTNPAYNTQCDQFINKMQSLGTSSSLNSATGVSYSCLLVDPQPISLLGQVNLGDQLVWPLVNANGTNFNNLTFTWAKDAASAKGTNCTTGNFPVVSSWPCAYGLLRVDIVQATDGSLNPASLTSNSTTGTVFFVPSTFGTAGTFQYKGQVDHALCSATNCSVTLPMPGNASSYYVRMTAMYQNISSLTLSGKDGSGSPVKFAGAQAVIDSTGKAQDELRRIKVSVPLTGAVNTPEFGVLATSGTCKYFLAVNGSAPNFPDTTTEGCTLNP